MDPTTSKKSVRALVLGGLLPVIAFTLVEEFFGIVWGVAAGMVFATGEIVYERVTAGRVSPITWGGGALILVLGGVSLLTREGIWFKLQPAILEAVMAVVLFGSCLAGKPFLLYLSEQQGALRHMPTKVHPTFNSGFTAMTWRLGVFFLVHAVLATWAAFEWSTRAWAILKGVGFTGSMILYLAIEVLYLRSRITRALRV